MNGAAFHEGLLGADDEKDGVARMRRRSGHATAARRYAVAAVACALFALVYAQFSHGVFSPFMTFMFAIPLIGGALPALGLHLAGARPAPRATRQSWALALTSLGLASCLHGIFEIAGTGSPYLVVYLAAAASFALLAAVFLAVRHGDNAV